MNENKNEFGVGKSEFAKAVGEHLNTLLGKFGVGQYCLVRSTKAGVFAGIVENNERGTVVVKDARRIWYWSGASSLSELAVRGPAHPEKCKFPCAVDRVQVHEVCEVLPCTDVARKAIEAVPEWRQHD